MTPDTTRDPESTAVRLTLFGHACLGIEAGGRRLLVDPWIIGSCYWRSWWHFPGPPEVPDEWLSPDAIYLSHHHFDHFHYPSMRKLARQAVVYIPRFGVDVMAEELRDLGFEHIVELAHGESTWLPGGTRIGSYQHGFDDSALVVAHGSTVIANLNDCKLRGRPLRQVVADFGRPTLMLRTHSWAQSYPILYEAEDPRDLSLVTDQTFLDDFADAAAVLQPRYAVPFANMVAFLHPESERANAHLITPDRVAERCGADPRLAQVSVVTMGPGDRWTSDGGFSLAPRAWWADRDERLAELRARHQPRLEEQAGSEATTADFDGFRQHLEEFARAVPRAVRRLMIRRPVAFAAPWDRERPWWHVDLRRGEVSRHREPAADVASCVHIAPGVLADAVDRRILHLVHGSMRIRTELRAGGASDDLAFWGLLMMYEIGYLPLRRLETRRFAGVLARRWREAADAADALLRSGRGTPLERLSGGFASPGAARPTDSSAA